MAKKNKLSAKQERAQEILYARAYLDRLYGTIGRKTNLGGPDTILGIDPSMTGAAYCVVDTKNKVSKIETIDTSKCKTDPETFAEIYGKLYHFCCHTPVQLVVYEEVTVSRNITGMLAVAQSKAAALTGVHVGLKTGGRGDKPLFLGMVNKTLKKSLAGDGKAAKEDMIAAANSVTGLDIEDDNMADAFAAAFFGNQLLQYLEAIYWKSGWYIDAGLEVAQKEYMQDVKEPSLARCRAARAVLKSSKNFKQNFGDYQYEKIRKIVTEL